MREQQDAAILREVERCLRLGLRYARHYPAAGADAVKQRTVDLERIEAARTMLDNLLQSQP